MFGSIGSTKFGFISPCVEYYVSFQIDCSPIFIPSEEPRVPMN